MVRQRPAKPCPFLGSAGSIPALSAHSTIHYSLFTDLCPRSSTDRAQACGA